MAGDNTADSRSEAVSEGSFTSWQWIWRDIVATAAVSCIAVMGGIVVAALYAPSGSGAALLWGLACLGLGALTGFLFGIPKVLQGGASSTHTAGKEESSDDSRLAVNTNLEQISDWITKIIVGLTLVEFDRFRQGFWGLSAFLATGMGASAHARVFAAGLIIYFVVVGFFAGYLLTRIYLTQAFRRADWGAEHMELSEGKLTLLEFAQQQNKVVSDLQEQVVRLRQQVGPTAESVAEAAPMRSVLWVDDHPKNNALLIDNLDRTGIEVVTVLTSAEALSHLRSRSFDAIISDMGRTESGKYNPEAGLELIRTVKSMEISTPIVIYCNRDMAARYRTQAIQLGAQEVTSSPTTLLASLKLKPAPIKSVAAVGGPI